MKTLSVNNEEHEKLCTRLIEREKQERLATGKDLASKQYVKYYPVKLR